MYTFIFNLMLKYSSEFCKGFNGMFSVIIILWDVIIIEKCK